MSQKLPLYQLDEHVLFTHLGSDYNPGAIVEISISQAGIFYNIVKDGVITHSVLEENIKSYSKLQRFTECVNGHRAYLNETMKIDEEDSAVKIGISNNIGIVLIDVIQCLGSAYLKENEDYDISVDAVSGSGGVVAIVFKENPKTILKVLKNRTASHTSISAEVKEDNTVIVEENGNLSVETPITTTVEDLVKLPIVVPTGSYKNILKSEHLKFLVGESDNLADEAVKLSVIRAMCKERLDDFRSLKPK